jgi:hypothetical protein
MNRTQALERLRALQTARGFSPEGWTLWRRGADFYGGPYIAQGRQNRAVWHWHGKSYEEVLDKAEKSQLRPDKWTRVR